MQNTLIVLDKNHNSREIIKSYLSEVDFLGEIKFFGDYIEGFEEIKKSDESTIVLMDMSLEEEDIKEMAGRIKLYASRLVLTSTDCSTDTIIKAFRMGAREFLPKPVLKDEMIKVLSFLAQKEVVEENSVSKVIAVYSNKGGIGKTTIAVNLAAELAKTTKEKVALVDLNLQLGDVSTFLNLNPTFDVNYVIKNLIDKDENVLIRAFEKYKDSSMYVLSDPSYIEQSENINSQQITALFKTLRRIFSYIIVDMSSNIDANTLRILDVADVILFTTIVNIPAIRNAQRCLTLFRSRKYPENKVKVVVNRYMENDEIKIDDIENTLNEKIYWKIPNNYFTIMEAINKGVCIAEINPTSNIGNSFKDFASKISDDIIEQSIVQYRV